MASRAPSSRTLPELRRRRTVARPVDLEPLTPVRYGSMSDVMRRAGLVDAPPRVARSPDAIYYDAVVCDSCGSGDREDQLLLCDRCDHGRHTFCLRPVAVEIPSGPWFCPDCAPPAAVPVKSRILKQTKIIDFFQIKKEGQDSEQSQVVDQVPISRDGAMIVRHIESAPSTGEEPMAGSHVNKETKRAFGSLKYVILIMNIMVILLLLVKLYTM